VSERTYAGRRRRLTVQDWLSLGWTRHEAERYGQLDHTSAEVLVLDASGVRPLRHFVRHSPNGFEWGYLGSGCAELARCILLDHYRVEPSSDPWEENGLPVSYQAFKQDVIARLPRHGTWSITSSEIHRWAQTHPARSKP
jgi:hypothetical protein